MMHQSVSIVILKRFLMNGKRVLITGGNGNIGSYLVPFLQNSGYCIYVLTKDSKRYNAQPGINVIEADITNSKELSKKLDFDLDYCVHLASFNEYFLESYAEKALEINALGTRNLLDALSKKNLKNFIYFSTVHVYGLFEGNIDESTSLNPKNDYASTHLFAEYWVKQYKYTHEIPYTILRLTNGYGAPKNKSPAKWHLILNNLIKGAFDNKVISLSSNGDVCKDLISLNNIGYVVEKLIKKNAANDTFNLASGYIYKLNELAVLVQEEYKKRYKEEVIIKLNTEDKYNYQTLRIDNSKLLDFIDFSFEDDITNQINNIFELLDK